MGYRPFNAVAASRSATRCAAASRPAPRVRRHRWVAPANSHAATSASHSSGERAHREDRNREPALGRRPHPARATRARLRGERGDGAVLSAEGAAASAVPVLANLPRQPPPAALGCGLLHRADAHLQDAVRLLLHHARAPPHRAFQRDGTSDSAVGVASVAGGDAVGAAAPLSDPGPRPLVQRCLHWQGASDRDQDGPHCGAGTGAFGGCPTRRSSRSADAPRASSRAARSAS